MAHGGGRSLASPAFPDDDGSADPALRTGLASGSPDLPALLAGARLLVAVVPVLDERDDATGADKRSSMAIVSMVNARGQRGLLAFSGTDALAAWDPQARPVPVSARDAARAAIDDGAEALVIDVAGPVRRVLEGAALRALAGDQEPPGP